MSAAGRVKTTSWRGRMGRWAERQEEEVVVVVRSTSLLECWADSTRVAVT